MTGDISLIQNGSITRNNLNVVSMIQGGKVAFSQRSHSIVQYPSYPDNVKVKHRDSSLPKSIKKGYKPTQSSFFPEIKGSR
jgi:hypothetical protein